MNYNGDYLLEAAHNYRSKIDLVKSKSKESFNWYPYGILNNFIHLKDIFNKYPLSNLANQQTKILDIGAADGDLSFFLEELGYKADIIDYGPTNYNNLLGAHALKKKLNSAVTIFDKNIDTQLSFPDESYELTILLGILYHLKNPFLVLEEISHRSKYLIISTRIARYIAQGLNVKNNSIAYLLDTYESNNDPTNFWIFSEEGLKTIFKRTGWDVLEYYTVGDTELSNPSDPKHDERAFALLRTTR